MGAYYYTMLSPGRCVDVELPDGSVVRAALAVFLGKVGYGRRFIQSAGRSLDPQQAFIERMAAAWEGAEVWPTHVVMVETRGPAGEKLPPKVRLGDRVYRLPAEGEKGHRATLFCDEADWFPTFVGWATGPVRRGRVTAAARMAREVGQSLITQELGADGRVTSSEWPL